MAFAASKDIDQSEFLAEFATSEMQFLVYVTQNLSLSYTLNDCNIL